MQVKPGLLGIGSKVFRDEVIAPYKGELEQWYVKHHNLYTYFMLIGLTVWVVLFSDSKVYKSIFKDLPTPPDSLAEWL